MGFKSIAEINNGLSETVLNFSSHLSNTDT